MPKRLALRAAARRDVNDAIAYYAQEAGAQVAEAFIEALRHSYRTIAARPALGSPRYAHLAKLPGLRSRKLGRFPYTVLYVERESAIEILRVLHQKRDFPDLGEG